MISVDAGQQSLLAAEYPMQGYTVLARLVDPEVAAGWELKHRLLPGRKVYVGNDRQTQWTEHWFSDPFQALDGLANAEHFINFVTRITGLNATDRSRSEVWLNRYSPGDRVPRHCDFAGSTQLDLCLQGLVEPERGGDLNSRDERIPLRTGDAVLFFARGLPHEILPMDGTKVGPSGFARVTCVIRLYAPNDP